VRTERPLCTRLPTEGKDHCRGGAIDQAAYRAVYRPGNGFGKRGTLKEDSSLGLEGVNMSEVDLSQLLGGKSFTVPCTLFRNGYGVTTTALANSRANAFALLNTKCAKKIAEFLNTPIETLEKPILVKGYDGQMGTPITSVFQTHF
jgi:hypothetical protein